MKNTLILSLIIALAFGLIGGCTFGYSRGAADTTAVQAQQIAAFKKIVPPTQPVTTLSGTLENINGDNITLQITSLPPFVYPLVNSFPLVRTVAVTANTKIMSVTQKDPAEFQSDIVAYQKQLQASSAGGAPNLQPIIVQPPVPFNETSTLFSNLKIGDSVTVIAATDITSASNFSATEIDLTAGGMP